MLYVNVHVAVYVKFWCNNIIWMNRDVILTNDINYFDQQICLTEDGCYGEPDLIHIPAGQDDEHIYLQVSSLFLQMFKQPSKLIFVGIRSG